MVLLLFLFSIWESKDYMVCFQPGEETTMLSVAAPLLRDLVSLLWGGGVPSMLPGGCHHGYREIKVVSKFKKSL